MATSFPKKQSQPTTARRDSTYDYDHHLVQLVSVRMADAAVFLRKRKDKLRRARSVQLSATATPSPSAKPSLNLNGHASSSSTSTSNGHLIELKLYSMGDTGLRHNIMKLNSTRDADPATLANPLLTRKEAGPPELPKFLTDEKGEIIGRYIYDPSGKPLLDDNGDAVVEATSRRARKKGVKEVFSQDLEVMRLRREEAVPWILESGDRSEGNEKPMDQMPEYWVGTMMEASTMPTVLLVNDVGSEGFSVVPLGRTYKFQPERPFKVLDPEAAHKLVSQSSRCSDAMLISSSSTRRNTKCMIAGRSAKLDPFGCVMKPTMPILSRERGEWNRES